LERAVSSIRDRKLELSKNTLSLLEEMGMPNTAQQNGGGRSADK